MWNFFKKALLSGLLILIPAVLVYLTLKELVDAMIGIATPIADLLPEGFIREDDWIPLIAFLLIVMAAMIIGVLWMAPGTRRVMNWLEHRTLYRVPMYRMLKSLVAAFLDFEAKDSFKPACLRHEDGSLEPIYVIENHGEDMRVIMQPWTPTPFAGSLKVVPASLVVPVDVSLDEFSLALTHFGLGLSDSLKKSR